MNTLDAIFDSSLIKIDKNNLKKKSKFLIDFSNKTDESSKLQLPVYNLGEVEIPQRLDIYNGKLSN